MNAALAESELPDFLSTFRRRVAEDLELLATLHDREPDNAILQELKRIDFPYCLTHIPDSGPGSEAVLLLKETLLKISDKVDDKTLNDLAADYASIYLTHNISASPEESVWLDEDNLICQQSMFDVRHWYKTYALEIPNWRKRPDDHLVYELQFIAHLLDKDENKQTLEKAATFMDEHLLRWLGNFGEQVLGRCDTQYFAGISALTAAYCEDLRDILAEILGQSRPSIEEIEERMKPKQAVPDETPVQFMPGLGPAV
ncbi:MAG: molecular chaperone TorD family protein [gamma proteobacterium symbiont of Taylorina sp.]|nr:molecular chaperone TorD family protein [gamma proteobacterium symbiont of Taylorina sp.]